MAGRPAQIILTPNRRKNLPSTTNFSTINSTKLKTISPPEQTLQTMSVSPSFFAKDGR